MSTGTYKNIYPNVKDLDRIPVHSEDGGKYFKVSNLPYSLSYGKHYFSISWYGDGLKDSSPLNFEFKDSSFIKKGTFIIDLDSLCTSFL